MNEEETKTENGTPLPAVSADVKAELEKEAAANDVLIETATAPLRQQITQLTEELTTSAASLAHLTQQVVTLQTDYDGALAAYAYSCADYKEVVLQSNPLLPPDLVNGATIQELKDSLAKANVIVTNVQSSITDAAAAALNQSRVPAGSPPRPPLDFSSMTTTDKIKHGLEQARRKN